jgi:hypothetical protein
MTESLILFFPLIPDGSFIVFYFGKEQIVKQTIYKNRLFKYVCLTSAP